MSSDAARAMYAYLAAKEEQQTKQPVRGQDTRPEWGKRPEPTWGEPPPVVEDYSKVPGLKRKVNR